MRKGLVGCAVLLLWAAAANGQGPPEASVESVVNAATLSGPPRGGFGVAQGSIITIFGRNLATKEAVATGFPLPTELAGTMVRFDTGLITGGLYGRLLYVSPSQINLVIPLVINTMSGLGFMEISTPQGTVRLPQISGGRVGPGVFTADSSGCGRPALWSYRLGRLISAEDSAQPGEILTLFGTGFGPPNPPDGEPAPFDPLLTPEPFYKQEIVFGDGTPGGLRSAEILWQGKAPGLAGVDQINFQVPEDIQQGCAVPFRVMNPRVSDSARYSQILNVPVSADGGACQNTARDGFLRLVLVREVNSAVANQPARRDRLWVDFFSSPPPIEPPPFQVRAGVCTSAIRGGFDYETRALLGIFLGRVCPGLEGVSEDALASTTVFDTRHWQAKTPQDSGEIQIVLGDQEARLRQGLPNGLPFYPPDLATGFLREGRARVSAAGGANIGPFQAEITLPPFAMTSNLSPGTVIGSRRFGFQRLRWSGGTANGIVRWWVFGAECGAPAGSDAMSFLPPPYEGIPGTPLPTMTILYSPDESEEVSFTANGLRYGGRLTYLYVYRFGGLRLTD